jgi:hypothetical protein
MASSNCVQQLAPHNVHVHSVAGIWAQNGTNKTSSPPSSSVYIVFTALHVLCGRSTRCCRLSRVPSTRRPQGPPPRAHGKLSGKQHCQRKDILPSAQKQRTPLRGGTRAYAGVTCSRTARRRARTAAPHRAHWFLRRRLSPRGPCSCAPRRPPSLRRARSDSRPAMPQMPTPCAC